MNTEKKIIFLIIIIITIIFSITYLFLYHTPSARNAKQNVANSLKIEVGMSKHEVIQIMGKPYNKRISFFNFVDTMYFYQPPFAAASGIYIQFDFDTNKVNRIILNE